MNECSFSLYVCVCIFLCVCVCVNEDRLALTIKLSKRKGIFTDKSRDRECELCIKQKYTFACNRSPQLCVYDNGANYYKHGENEKELILSFTINQIMVAWEMAKMPEQLETKLIAPYRKNDFCRSANFITWKMNCYF